MLTPDEVLLEVLRRLDQVSDDRGLPESHDFNDGAETCAQRVQDYRDELLRENLESPNKNPEISTEFAETLQKLGASPRLWRR